MKIWDKDAERGVVLGAIAAILVFAFIFPDPDADLSVVFPGNPPYGWLWYMLNPMYWTKRIYPLIVVAEWATVTALEYFVARKKWIPMGLVKLQIISTMFLMMLHAYQDITVIMFAPLILIHPVFVGFEIMQKIPAYGSAQWNCAFNGTGTDANAYQFPCLSNTTHFLTWNHIYWMTYPILILWVVLPLVMWYKNEMRKVGFGRGGHECKNDRCKFKEKWKGEGAEEPSIVDPPIRTQPSAPFPTKPKISRLDILMLLALGVTAHDVAVVEGVHIPGLHAFYFSVPMIVIILTIKMERRIKKWKKK